MRGPSLKLLAQRLRCAWTGPLISHLMCVLPICSPQEAYEEFEAGRVSWEAYAERADELLADPELTIRLGAVIMPWRDAQAYIVGQMFYGHGVAAALKPRSCIPVVRLLLSFMSARAAHITVGFSQCSA